MIRFKISQHKTDARRQVIEVFRDGIFIATFAVEEKSDGNVACRVFSKHIPETFCAEVAFDPRVVQEFVHVTRNASQMSAKALECGAIEEEIRRHAE
jgi:hypothetical protein